MKNKNDKMDEIWFELNGVLFPDMDSAIAAAKESILQKLSAVYPPAGYRMVTTDFEIHGAIEPVGCKTVVSTCLVSKENGELVRPCGEDLFLSIKQVRPDSPLFGKYVAQFWNREDLSWWCTFDKYQTADAVTTYEEIFYGNMAVTIADYLSGRKSISELSEELGCEWRVVTDELRRNQIAETFLCAQDLGLLSGFSYHELLEQFPDIVLRAQELALIRDEARLLGAR